MNELSNEQELQDLVNQITKLVESSKASIAANVNTIITETYHNVGYCSMIVQLWSARSVILDLTIDYAEFEWLE